METSVPSNDISCIAEIDAKYLEERNAFWDKELLRPYNYLTTAPGKRIRHVYAKTLNVWMKIPDEKLSKIDDIIHSVHNCGLLLDDIQDRTLTRRGKPAAHTVFGFTNTVLSVDYMICATMTQFLELNHPEAINIYFEEYLHALRGQGMEIYCRENNICPTIEEYIENCEGKTGTMFNIIFRLMQLFSQEEKQDFSKLSNTICLYFQIVDDYKNLTDQMYFDSKGFCEDITEGKCSFPIIHAVNTHPEEGKIIMDILRQRTQDVELKKYCLSLIEKCGSFEYTRNKLKELKALYHEEINRIGPNKAIKDLFDSLIYI